MSDHLVYSWVGHSLPRFFTLLLSCTCIVHPFDFICCLYSN